MVVTPGRCCCRPVGAPETLLRPYHAQDRPHSPEPTGPEGGECEAGRPRRTWCRARVAGFLKAASGSARCPGQDLPEGGKVTGATHGRPWHQMLWVPGRRRGGGETRSDTGSWGVGSASASASAGRRLPCRVPGPPWPDLPPPAFAPPACSVPRGRRPGLMFSGCRRPGPCSVRRPQRWRHAPWSPLL